AMKRIFKHSADGGYAGFRAGDGWNRSKPLPRQGHIHVAQLSPHLPGAWHVHPYASSVQAAMHALVNDQEAPSLQVCRLGQTGLGSDGAYVHAVMYFSLSVLAMTAVHVEQSGEGAIPDSVLEALGAIRVVAVEAKAAQARLIA
ncbi:unnamed protein product, partial [Effrenium voratum]